MGEPTPPARPRQMLPPTYLLLALATMAVLRFALPVRRIIPLPWTLLGIVPFVAGVVLNIVADRAFKRHRTTVKPFKESTALITTGAYAVSRHPMYLGFTLVLLGMAVFMGRLTPFAVVVLFPVLMEIKFIRTEERMMAQQFGDAWLAYRARVRRWI